MFVQFGCGDIYVNPISGNQATNPTAAQIMTVQDVSLEIDQKLVELKGQNKGPEDVATSDMTVKGKVTMGRLDMDMFNNVYFGEAPTTGITAVAVTEVHSIPAMMPFTVTVTNSAQFGKDLGVRYNSGVNSGQPFTRVAAGPTTGQYSVAAGVYTFVTGDQGLSVIISYSYNIAASGKTLTVHNQLQGYGPVVEMFLWEPYASALNISTNNGWHLYAVRFGKLAQPLKRDNFTYPTLDYEAYPNASGQWFDMIDGGGF